MLKIINKIYRLILNAIILFISLSVFSVILFRFVNPPVTPLMIIRYVEHENKNVERRIEKQWVSLNEISPNMVWAVIAAEDNNFPVHNGVDFDAIKKAQELNKYSKIKHGASTISQQTAKNVFLTPSRTYVRKGFELYFTYLIETFWGKKRIMEVYLNVIELGDGIYGVEEASQRFFKKPASKLTRAEAALITSALPSPRKRNLARPNNYMRWYQNRVITLMNQIGPVSL
jgi:monofunctional glycosyltransferase